MTATRTADLIAYQAMGGKKMNDGDYSPYVIFEGSDNRYDSGSHIDATTYHAVFGGNYQLHDVTLGAFMAYGESDYDTYNSFAAEQIHGFGKTKHYGLGVLAKYMPATTPYYLEASLQAGQAENEFNTRDIITGGGTFAHYESEHDYLSGHVGVGYQQQLDQKNIIDTSVKYLATRLSGEQVMIDGEQVNLDALNSSRVQLKGEWHHQYSPIFGIVTGVGYEHEFESKTNVGVKDYDLQANPSVEGGTAFTELGFTYNPFKSADSKLIDFRIKGYTGEREGIAALINLKHTF